jgi:hypothetical protein
MTQGLVNLPAVWDLCPAAKLQEHWAIRTILPADDCRAQFGSRG